MFDLRDRECLGEANLIGISNYDKPFILFFFPQIDGLDENDAIISARDMSEDNADSLADFNDSDDKGSEQFEDIQTRRDEDQNFDSIPGSEKTLGMKSDLHGFHMSVRLVTDTASSGA